MGKTSAILLSFGAVASIGVGFYINFKMKQSKELEQQLRAAEAELWERKKKAWALQGVITSVFIAGLGFAYWSASNKLKRMMNH